MIKITLITNLQSKEFNEPKIIQKSLIKGVFNISNLLAHQKNILLTDYLQKSNNKKKIKVI